MTGVLVGAFLIVFVAQLVKGVVGFGSALVAIPVLALLYGPADAVFISTTCDIVALAVLLPGVWRHVRWRLLAILVLPALATQYLATDLLADLPHATFRAALGVLILLMGLKMAIRPVQAGRGELRDMPDEPGGVLAWGGAAGAAAGVLSGLFGTPGPPLIIYGKHFFADRFMRAQLIAVFAPISLTLLVMLVTKDAVTDVGALLGTGALLIPAVALGGLAGAALSPRVSAVIFGRVVGVLLTLAGVGLITA